MASIRSYVNGAGGSAGAALATVKPLFMSGAIWYVGNAVAGASDSNAGTDRRFPFATLAKAVSVAAATDEIDLLAGHSETISSNLAISLAGLKIVGEGSGGTLPRLTNGVAAATNAMITVTASGVQFDSIHFPASPAVARERIFFTGAIGGSRVTNCVFDCGANDTSRSLKWSTSGPEFASGLTFTSTGSTPGPAIEPITSNLTMDNIVIDGGAFGWNANGAIYSATAVTGMCWTRIQLLNGSNITLPTGSTGVIHVSAQSGDSEINWTP